MKNIREIWAEGIPLSDALNFFKEIEVTDAAPTVSLGLGIRRSQAELDRDIEKRAIEKLRKTLSTGKLMVVGRKVLDEDQVSLEEIPPDFWPAANFNLSEDGAWQPGWSYLSVTVDPEAFSKFMLTKAPKRERTFYLLL